MKSSTMLYAFLSLQVENSETKGPHQKYKRIKTKTKQRNAPTLGTIYINATSKNKIYINNTVVGTTEIANRNN